MIYYFFTSSFQLVEKLSAKAPDGPTKVKILSAIATEHNIKWDPNSFGDMGSNPSEDLLVRLNQFEVVGSYFLKSQLKLKYFLLLLIIIVTIWRHHDHIILQ